jgi:hypothetical protein
MSKDLLNTISIERLNSIEREREEVMGSIEFQNWVAELNVSQSYEDPTPKLKAREIMSLWESSPNKWVGAV